MIDLSDCSVHFKEQALLKSISLSVSKGDFFCLIGESGGGKTLLGKMILGFLPKEFRVSGSIQSDREKMEIILQNPIGSMQSNVPVETQFHHLLKSRGMKNREEREKEMLQVLSWVGFSDRSSLLAKRPFQLSGGMCQKVAMAMALVSDPEIIIADEATSALDEQSQETILNLLRGIYEKKQITIFFITHDLTIVKKYSTHVGIIKDGRLIEAGPTNQVLSKPKEKYTKELIEIFEGKY
ncbi:ATP-binding cassette domain-containing protein [Brevibacillus laterosporus]|uniref:ATP-binding cassette domain-containing protein n=1 Tax=Brevibacillus laterosporus TaxID=1465 RepID=UPI000CE37BD6|nr:ATP-binding cassette domain-containing protein [Brevibacillus laterosporus]MBG9799100.1 methionine ABC transporter ATP-binding protein [Brevibacillus laterosporus]MCR8939245.1 ATP-binding cassette domain-containing protein [Brevibacillus laterosporus]MCZ0841885.1 ATP-binding cassette domain-containing protein [Brevibacillus laterosporus]MCZ0847507.1 ATP-binding cassette domain-containing protein [Brevibacillus laterosporus]MED1911893.1 ATP-binding cassette domain-containing protein [Breviba